MSAPAKVLAVILVDGRPSYIKTLLVARELVMKGHEVAKIKAPKEQEL